KERSKTIVDTNQNEINSNINKNLINEDLIQEEKEQEEEEQKRRKDLITKLAYEVCIVVVNQMIQKKQFQTQVERTQRIEKHIKHSLQNFEKISQLKSQQNLLKL